MYIRIESDWDMKTDVIKCKNCGEETVIGKYEYSFVPL
jgi:hypothetical protein